ncbi:MAG: c-type cytochrome biogenesis protein CcsB [Firmicutes bacterium]|nr:c-type cytochrome biogenesis protein CcsB [Bacillota bacterium]
MASIKLQLLLFWVSVGFCFGGTFFFVSCLTFKKENFLKYAVLLSYLAFLPLTAALADRWIQTGHFPYWGVYEVFSSYAWGALLFYLIVQLRKPNLKIAGTVVLPAVMLMIGVAVMNSAEMKEIPKTFFTYWLGIHILFAKLSYGSVLISAALALSYLIKSKQEEKGDVSPLMAKLPDIEKIDHWSYQFAAFAFVMLGIMIASGAVWAYKAWGRYWNWDPIETWALISWLVYGLYLHLRITLGWKGKRASWLALFAVFLVVFAFFGVPLISDSVHEHLKYTR